MRWNLVVATATLVPALALALTAQTGQAPKASEPASDPDRFERAHDGLLRPQPETGADASQLTQEAVRTLPALDAGADQVPRKNLIDEHIFGRMDRDRIPHAPLANDEEFVRRAYIDAIGQLPTPEAVMRFVSDRRPDKRDALVDTLIGSEEFAEQWAWFFGGLMQSQKEGTYWWTKQWLKRDRPYDETFREIVTSTAKTQVMLPASYFHYPAMYGASRAVPSDPDDYSLTNRLDFVDTATVNLTRIFLGLGTDCVSCHDGARHLEPINLYLSKRTRREFHSQAAFLGRMRLVSSVNRGFAVDPQDAILDDSGPGYSTGNDAPFYTPAEGRFPRKPGTYEPAFFLTGETPRPGEDPRKALARIMPTHIQFSRAAVNLIWSRLMVVGFVEPYDGFDMDRLDPKNPPPAPWTLQPTNPELLDALANDFRANGFRLHRLLKLIMKSSAYQLAAQFPGEWKDAYIPYYARRFVRVLTGSEVLDAIAQATERPYQFGDDKARPLGEPLTNLEGATRVKQLHQPLAVRSAPREGNEAYALIQAFFEGSREGPAVLGNNATPVQAMLMMASSLVNTRTDATPGTRVYRLLESKRPDAEVIDQLFLAALSRRPLVTEREAAVRLLQTDRRKGAQKLQWALLNSAEFLLNH